MTDVLVPRVRYRDLKPYETVDVLDELAGPASGKITLPLRVRWVPGERTYDLSAPGQLRLAYQAVLAEGTAQDMRDFLNKYLLIDIWPSLHLDRRIIDLWEERHPQLQGSSW